MAERAGDGGGGDHGDTVLRRDGDDDLQHRLGVLGMEAPMTSEGMCFGGMETCVNRWGIPCMEPPRREGLDERRSSARDYQK